MKKKDMDEQTREIVESFVAEGYERLDDAEAQLGKMNRACEDDCLKTVFRLFHSLKGSAGFLNFEAVKELTHEAETLLDLFIKEGYEVTPDSLDVIYATIDVLREMIETIESEYSDEALTDRGRAQSEAVRAMVASLRAAGPAGAPAAPKSLPSDPPAAQAPLDVASTDGPAVPTTPQDQAPQEDPPPGIPNEIFLSELASRDMAERFLAECADTLDGVERKALDLPSTADGAELVNDIFRAVHTLKGNAGYFGYAYLEQRCMALESVLDGVRKGRTPRNEALTNRVISFVDEIRAGLATVSMREPGIRLGSAPASEPGAEAGGHSGPTGAAGSGAEVEAAPKTTNSSGSGYRPLGEILVDLGAAREEMVQKALELQEKPIGAILVDSGAVRPEDVEKALSIQKAAAPERVRGEEIQRKEIRVDTAKLDKLFELVGELITAEAMVFNSPDLKGLKLDRFNKAALSLSKISREIQETTMMIRMIPLEALFHKMTRLVHDLSRKFGKPVELRVTGQETEMDKNVIEQISDPLVHILRNAVDHGIETAEVRARQGKPAVAEVDLEARYEGSEIWITVRDDGAGLNREKILATAEKKGLLKGDPASLPDEEVWRFIFEPGFSTADKVSEVSGRGVGMDVVNKNMERVRGRVDIRSQAGKGTEFTLKIPLTMAIIDGLTLRSGGSFYSVPLGDILEFFKATPSQLTTTNKGQEVINLRGTILPLLKLGGLFKIPGASMDPLQGIIIVVKSADRKACLLIDEVVGNQQIVVKSLSEYLGKVDGISGCSILGDGTVSFIIDTGRLLSLALE